MWVDDETVRKRCKRWSLPGHAHELTFSCHRKLPMLERDRTRQWLAKAIDRARVVHAFDLWAYVFMPTHVHLIVNARTAEYSGPEILRSIKQPVGRRAINFLRSEAPDWLLNLAVTESGGVTHHSFWQAGGGYDRNVTDVNTLWEMIDYLHLNPVLAGLVPSADEWVWSSARWHGGKRDGPLSVDTPPLASPR